MIGTAPDNQPMGYIPFQKIVEERCGLVFDGEMRKNLFNGLSARMSITGNTSHQDYRNRLLSDEAEFLSLISLLTNNETYFFREPIHLEIMATHLLPDLLTRRQRGNQVRILSAGCATGEEAYSVVITLLEQWAEGNRELFTVTAVDIDDQALDKARMGIFGNNAFRTMDAALLEKYFRQQRQGQYALLDAIKAKVSFSHLNLCHADYPSSLHGMDIILFRNVSIYFSPTTRHAVFRKLANLLNPGGCLLLSSTEVFHHSYLLGPGDTLALEAKGPVFFFRKAWPHAHPNGPPPSPPSDRADAPASLRKTATRRPLATRKEREKGRWATSIAAKKSTPLPIPRIVDPRRNTDTRQQFDAAIALARDGRYEMALTTLTLVKDPTVKKPVQALKACILLNNQRFEMARELCLEILESDPLHPESLVILGLATRQTEKPDAVIQYLKKAVYVRPSCWLPHYYLGEAYQALGQSQPACREYQVVLHQLNEDGGFANHGLPFFEPNFSHEALSHLCRKKLNDMNTQTSASPHRGAG